MQSNKVNTRMNFESLKRKKSVNTDMLAMLPLVKRTDNYINPLVKRPGDKVAEAFRFFEFSF